MNRWPGQLEPVLACLDWSGQSVAIQIWMLNRIVERNENRLIELWTNNHWREKPSLITCLVGPTELNWTGLIEMKKKKMRPLKPNQTDDGLYLCRTVSLREWDPNINTHILTLYSNDTVSPKSVMSVRLEGKEENKKWWRRGLRPNQAKPRRKKKKKGKPRL